MSEFEKIKCSCLLCEELKGSIKKLIKENMKLRSDLRDLQDLRDQENISHSVRLINMEQHTKAIDKRTTTPCKLS